MRGGAALVGTLIDARFGEPPTRLHPVVGMGQYLGLKDKLSRGTSPYTQGFAGAGFVLVGAAASGVAAWGTQRCLRRLSPAAEVLGTGLLLKPLFSLSALLEAGNSVSTALLGGDLPEARRRLGWHLVSRDTSALSESEVAGAAVASLAENLTDSVIAPFFYFALFGLPGAAVYRFINTADAVLGYRTPELEYFGKFAARSDDVLTFVPARLSAGLLLLALKAAGLPARKSWSVMLRDRRRTPSPNGGLTMALTAAGLGVKLTKRGAYTLNGGGRDPVPTDVTRTKHLVALTTLSGFGLYALVSRFRRA